MRKIIVLMLLVLGGCSSVPTIPTLSAYKMDIQQGNYVTQDMVAKLKPGMTRAQVRFILGTPLVVDVFRTDRWDYVYVFQKAGKVTEQRKLTVIFADDKLLRVEGDVVPAGSGEAGKTGDAAAEKAKPAADGGSAKPETGAVPNPEPSAIPSKPETGAAPPKTEPGTAPSKPEPGAAPSGSGGSNLTTGSGEPVKAETPKPDLAKPDSSAEKPQEEQSKEQKPEEEKGFFGRMLDKIGL
jgi:outer membrane protein assembly factor BamE